MALAMRYLIVLLIVYLIPGCAQARTWRVERDGGGDYTSIRPALNAAAPGDTLLLGPGRFTETHLVEAPYDTGMVYVELATDSITFIGSGAGVTIIGPEDSTKRTDHWPRGILGWNGATGCRVEGLTIENVRNGISLDSGVIVQDCSFLNNVDAISLVTNGEPVHISETRFEGNAEDPIIAWGPCPLFVVQDCTFENPYGGIGTMSMDSVLVADCTFNGHIVAIQYDSCQGEIRDCHFANGVNADVVSIGSHLSLNNCQFSSAYRAISARTWGELRGQGNIIPPGEGERIRVVGTSMWFNNNHILRGDGPCVRLVAYTNPGPEVLDFTNNYWGTSEADSIAAWIWDENDDSNVQGEVVFDPFSPVPLPDEKKSLGDVKRMFR